METLFLRVSQRLDNITMAVLKVENCYALVSLQLNTTLKTLVLSISHHY
jgi:hypothetical protein